jgi:hypothetical protein
LLIFTGFALAFLIELNKDQSYTYIYIYIYGLKFHKLSDQHLSLSFSFSFSFFFFCYFISHVNAYVTYYGRGKQQNHFLMFSYLFCLIKRDKQFKVHFAESARVSLKKLVPFKITTILLSFVKLLF